MKHARAYAHAQAQSTRARERERASANAQRVLGHNAKVTKTINCKTRSKNSNAMQARTTSARTYIGVKTNQQQRDKAIQK